MLSDLINYLLNELPNIYILCFMFGFIILGGIGPVCMFALSQVSPKGGWYTFFTLGISMIIADMSMAIISWYLLDIVTDFVNDNKFLLVRIVGVCLILISVFHSYITPKGQSHKNAVRTSVCYSVMHPGNWMAYMIFFLVLQQRGNTVTEVLPAIAVGGLVAWIILSWFGVCAAYLLKLCKRFFKNLFAKESEYQKEEGKSYVSRIFFGLFGLAMLITPDKLI